MAQRAVPRVNAAPTRLYGQLSWWICFRETEGSAGARTPWLRNRRDPRLPGPGNGCVDVDVDVGVDMGISDPDEEDRVRRAVCGPGQTPR